MSRGASRPRRLLHPGAWWAWAAGCSAAALRTTNPLLLGLLLAAVAFVVASRRSDAPWARSFASFLRLGAVVIAVRMVFQILFGNRIPGTTLFTLPSLALPDWAAGVSLGGPVTAEALVGAFYQGLRLAVVIACFGAASSLCSPYRLLRAMPSALYEAGVAVTVALTFAPQAVVAARQVREARRLRGRADRGPAAWRGSALPVLEGALERAVALAASMDARGYGRVGATPVRIRRLAAGLTLAGLGLAAVGSYALLDPSAPAALRVPVLALAAAALVAALLVSGRGQRRTRYRPDPWALPEWGVSSGRSGPRWPAWSWPAPPVPASIRPCTPSRCRPSRGRRWSGSSSPCCPPGSPRSHPCSPRSPARRPSRWTWPRDPLRARVVHLSGGDRAHPGGRRLRGARR